MKILIICVNYNSYNEMHTYLNSISKASNNADVELFVKIADNSDPKNKELQFNNYNNISVEYFDFPNLGYFGSAFKVLNSIDHLDSFDYVFITNVDICFPENFIKILKSVKVEKDIGWIVPDIYSPQIDKHHNPYLEDRLSKFKININLLLYKYPLFLKIYENTLHKLKYKKTYTKLERHTIYAGHGSCFILTTNYFKNYIKVESPLFLYGEELLIAEENRLRGLKVLFLPELQVIDYEHVSTGKMLKKNRLQANIQSLKYIKRQYY